MIGELTHLTEAEKAYFAGIIDGDGSIALVRNWYDVKKTKSRRAGIYAKLRVFNTDLLLIEWIRVKIGLSCKTLARRLPSGDRRKSVYQLAWTNVAAVKILRAVLPYLVIKRTRAEIVISLYERSKAAQHALGGGFNAYRPVPEWLRAERETAFEAVAHMNKKGRP